MSFTSYRSDVILPGLCFIFLAVSCYTRQIILRNAWISLCGDRFERRSACDRLATRLLSSPHGPLTGNRPSSSSINPPGLVRSEKFETPRVPIGDQKVDFQEASGRGGRFMPGRSDASIRRFSTAVLEVSVCQTYDEDQCHRPSMQHGSPNAEMFLAGPSQDPRVP